MGKCLIVDDSKVIRMVARRILEDLNFETEEAEDGEQAINICRREMPASILLDWNMPVMNGIEFLHVLRAMEGVKQPVVVFCSSENDTARIEEAMNSGADEYIMKPFDSLIIETKFRQVGLLEDSDTDPAEPEPEPDPDHGNGDGDRAEFAPST